eukprot:1145430-Pelagomonas_calceolata.AAC.3
MPSLQSKSKGPLSTHTHLAWASHARCRTPAPPPLPPHQGHPQAVRKDHKAVAMNVIEGHMAAAANVIEGHKAAAVHDVEGHKEGHMSFVTGHDVEEQKVDHSA